MTFTNSQCIGKLKKKIKKDKNLRYDIVLLDTILGICNARRIYSDQFKKKYEGKRQTTQEILESKEIIEQRQRTLKYLDKKKHSQLIDRLSTEIYSNLETIELPDVPLYNNIRLLMKRDDLRYMFGKNIEDNLGGGLIQETLHAEFTLIARGIEEGIEEFERGRYNNKPLNNSIF